MPIRCGPDKVEELHFSLAPVELCPIALTGFVPPDCSVPPRRLPMSICSACRRDRNTHYYEDRL